MANLDTRSKRASSVSILLPFMVAPVFPDGTLDQGDRQHIALSYSGILAGGGPLLDVALSDAAVNTATLASMAVNTVALANARVTTLTLSDVSVT